MKKFALVCTNEEHRVVSVSIHEKREVASERMRKEYEAERSQYEDPEEDLLEDVCGSFYAVVKESEDNLYQWEVVEVED